MDKLTNAPEIITTEEKEELVTEMKQLLRKYDYTPKEEALSKIIDTWAVNKADLISAFKKHPNYIEGKFMIALNKDYKRGTQDSKLATDKFMNWLLHHVIMEPKYINALPEDVKKEIEEDDGIFIPMDMYNAVALSKGVLVTASNQFLTEEQASEMNDIFPFVHAHTGQKTNRVVNKIFKYLGYNKHPNYEREYAKYSDALTPLTIKRHTVLSINPLDYLTMSFGNSWASCHTIDKKNIRNMPDYYGGCYSSGTISYMLDSTSMVFYTVDKDYNGDKFYTQDKINRQMFHWQHPRLLQGRLYPQGNNSGSDNIYEQYRNIVQEIMSNIYEVSNLWKLEKGTRAIESEGTHYHDYIYYDSCILSTLRGEEDDCTPMRVGHKPICIVCGCEHDYAENISCCGKVVICADCGEEIFLDRDNFIKIGEEGLYD